jgi:hypothetical protein
MSSHDRRRKIGDVGPSRLVRDVDAFSESLIREAYLVGAGIKPKGDESRIYRRWRRLFLPSARRLLPEGPPRQRARLDEMLRTGYVDRAVAPWQDLRRNRLLRSTVLWEKERLPFFTAQVRLPELPEQEHRHDLYVRLAAVWRSVRREEEGVWATFSEGVRSLGYQNGLDAAEHLGHYGVPHLIAETQRFVASSDPLYRELLSERAEAEGLRRADLRVFDSGRLNRGAAWTSLFPRAGVLPFLRRSLRELGLPTTAFRSDLAPRPRKNPRAFCAPVRIPQEVYLVLRPQGGANDYHTALHEMGHALHFGLTDPALDPVFKRQGDSSLTEGWAFVLDLLFLNPEFMRRLTRDRSFARYWAFTQYYLLRRYAGKIAYESRFFRDPLAKGLRELYVQCQSRTTLFRPDPELGMADRWRSDVDPWLYTAAYLRAWMFAGAFTLLLEDRWGERWWSDPAAGAFLSRLWARGQHPTVEELLEEFGRGELSLRPLEELLRRSISA